MKYAIEMGSGAMRYEYIPLLIRIASAIQKFMAGYTDTQTAW
jgi:hypothetical protein